MARYLVTENIFDNPQVTYDKEFSGLSIEEALVEVFKERPDGFERPMMALVNGELVEPEDFPTYFPSDVCQVVFTERTEGIIGIIITVISLVVSVYLALNMPVPTNPNTDFNSAPSYTLQGRSNKRKLDEPIEVHYGQRKKYYPSYAAASYTRIVDGKQKLMQLFCVGQGDQEFTDADLRIEGTPLLNYEGVRFEVVRPPAQPTLFATNVETSGAVQDIELLGSNDPSYPVDGWYGAFAAGSNPASDTVFRIECDLTLPNGAYRQNDDGGTDPIFINIEAQYQALDETGTPTGSWLNLFTWSQNLHTTSTLRKTFETEISSPSGTFQVRMRRVNTQSNSIRVQDTVLWSALKAYKENEQGFGNVTLIAIEAEASNALSGGAAQKFNMDFTAYHCHLVNGNMTYEPNRDITAAFVDVITNTDYGMGLPSSVIDWDTIKEVEAEFQAEGRFFDWTFDQKLTAWEALQAICRCGRARPLIRGSYFTIKRDKPIPLAQALFTSYNTVSGSFNRNYKLSRLGDYDGVEIEYVDETTGNPEILLCLLGDDEGTNPERIQFVGMSNRDWAYREGLYIRAQRLLQRDQIQFTTGMEGLTVEYGDRIAASHEVLKQGAIVGRVVDISGTTITVDQPLVFNVGITYSIAIRGNDGGVLGSYVVTEGANESEAILSAPITGWEVTEFEEPPFFAFGESVRKDYKVTSITPQNEEEVLIEAVNYDELIYSYDTETAPDFITVPSVPALPEVPTVANLQLTQGVDLTKATATWDDLGGGADYYILQVSLDNENWTDAGTHTVTTAEIFDTPVGQYYARVAGVSTGRGAWATWSGTLGTATLNPDNVPAFRLLNQFTGLACETTWSTPNLAEGYNMKVYILPADTLVFDDDLPLQNTYSFTAEDVATVTPPLRDYRLEIVATNSIGTSETAQTLTVNNPAPAVPTGITSVIVTEDATSVAVQMTWSVSTAADFSKYRVHASDTSGFTPDGTNLVYEGTANQSTFVIQKVNGLIPEYFWRVAALDTWGEDANYSAEQTTEQFINVLQVNPTGDILEVNPSGDNLSTN